MDAPTGLAGHEHVVSLEALGTMRGYWGHGARPEGLVSLAHPSKAASAGAELALGFGFSQVPSVVQRSPSRG